MILTKRTVECSEQAGFKFQDYGPIPMTGIQLCEVAGVWKLRGYLSHSEYLVIIPVNDLVQTMRIKTEV